MGFFTVASLSTFSRTLLASFASLSMLSFVFFHYSTPVNRKHLAQVTTLVIQKEKVLQTGTSENTGKIALPKDVSQEWWSRVRKNLKDVEYSIRWRAEANSWQSSNHKQDMRFSYEGDNFNVVSRLDSKEKWEANVKLHSINRGDSHVLYPQTLGTEKAGDTLRFMHESFVTEYINTEEGMRQNFILQERPKGDGLLIVQMSIGGTVQVEKKGEDHLLLSEITDEGIIPRMCYKDLHVFDANGKELTAWMEVENQNLSLVVRDDNAQYPILIDPLSTSPDWSATLNDENAKFGSSVASAGDVNGDGFGDVIVGAPFTYENEEAGGYVIAYYGSAAGLSETSSWIVISDQIGSGF